MGDEVYSRVLDDHHRIIRTSLAAHGGREEGTQGDAFFASFASTSACVEAALEAQLAIARHRWPEGEELRVRMGVHTGEASETATGLVGYEVHRAARIASVGYGGQVLLSSASAGLVEDTLAPGVGLKSLGEHRLKDLGRPESLFQLEAEHLVSAFPPLRSLDNPELPNNLPASLSPFVGRSLELSEVRVLVSRSRLVTLTGAGGSGKTRLALQAAAELLDGTSDGVWFVALAPLTDPDQVAGAVLDALRIRRDGGVLALDALVAALRDQRVLIVLDNCEHVVGAVAKLVDVIGRGCPRVSVVATSREPLGVDGEQIYRVPSLSAPTDDVEALSDLEGFDAAELFLVRAHLQDSRFAPEDSMAPLVASICRRLDGIPLAIELAVARLSSMSIADLHDRLDQRFRLLTGGSRNALPRQQTLGAMVAWSYDLLSESERAVLRRLSVFVNGFDLAAAEAVCAHGIVESFDVVDIVGSLANKSLINVERTSGASRYRLLETIRQYAAEQLLQADGEAATRDARRRHAEHYLSLCEADSLWERVGRHQVEWMRALDFERDNLLMAFAYFSDDLGDVDQVYRLAVASECFLATRAMPEPLDFLAAAVGRDQRGPSLVRGRALHVLIVLSDTVKYIGTDRRIDVAAREDIAVQILDIARVAGDSELEALALLDLADSARVARDLERAGELAAAALSIGESLGDDRLQGWALLWHIAGDIPDEERRTYLHESIRRFRAADDRQGLFASLTNAAVFEALAPESLGEAIRLSEEALRVAEEIGSSLATTMLETNLGVLRMVNGDAVEAEALARRSLIAAHRFGGAPMVTQGGLWTLAICSVQRGDAARAAQLMGAYDAMVAQMKSMPDQFSRELPMEVELEDQARRLMVEGLGAEGYERQVTVGRHLGVDDLYDLALGRRPPE